MVEKVPGESYLFTGEELAIAGISDKLSEIHVSWCVYCMNRLGDYGSVP